MDNRPFDNVAVRLRAGRLALSSVLPPFRSAYWKDAEVLKSELGLTGVALGSLGTSRAAQERFLERLAARTAEGAAFRPESIGYGARAGQVIALEEFRSGYRLVKLLGKSSREVVLGALEAVCGQVATRGRIEVHFRQWDEAGAGFDGLEAAASVVAFLRGAGRYGAPVILFSDLRGVVAELWRFVYDRPLLRLAWVASELVTCAGPDEFEGLRRSSAALKNLREISDGGLWPHVVLPVSSANVSALPWIVAGLLELTRGGSIDIVPACLLPGLHIEVRPPEPAAYAQALLELYADPVTPLRRISPLSWVAARMDSQSPLPCSPATAGAEVAVLPDGELYASEFGVGVERWRIGNVLKESESLRWERLDATPEIFSYPGHVARCRGCDWRFRCGGLHAAVFVLEAQHQARPAYSGEPKPRPPDRQADGGQAPPRHLGAAASAAAASPPQNGRCDGASNLLAELYCEPRRRLFEEMLWSKMEAVTGQPRRGRERLELSGQGVGYVPVAHPA